MSIFTPNEMFLFLFFIFYLFDTKTETIFFLTEVSHFDCSGTVFREPLLCRNVPRIVPGNVFSYHCIKCVQTIVLFSFITYIFQVGRNPFVLVDMPLVINIVLLIQSLKDQESSKWSLVSWFRLSFSSIKAEKLNFY